MNSSNSDDELAYHLRELRADLGLAQGAVEVAASGGGDPSVVRAWVQAEALLAHDLEVHVPRALVLLGAARPAKANAPTVGMRRTRDRAAAAREVGLFVGTALAALDAEAVPLAARLTTAAQAIAAAHQIVARTSIELME